MLWITNGLLTCALIAAFFGLGGVTGDPWRGCETIFYILLVFAALPWPLSLFRKRRHRPFGK